MQIKTENKYHSFSLYSPQNYLFPPYHVLLFYLEILLMTLERAIHNVDSVFLPKFETK